MALIKCPECGKKISNKANACIHCGYPITSMKKNIISVEERIKNGLDGYIKAKKDVDDLKKILDCSDINNRNEQYLSHISFPLPFYF